MFNQTFFIIYSEVQSQFLYFILIHKPFNSRDSQGLKTQVDPCLKLIDKSLRDGSPKISMKRNRTSSLY